MLANVCRYSLVSRGTGKSLMGGREGGREGGGKGGRGVSE